MRFYLYPAAVLLAGVLAAQILFSALVYYSDISLYQNLVAIKQAGYLIVPNQLVLPGLQTIKPAVCGGVFFALTTGAGLTLVTFFFVSLWRRYSRNNWLLVSLFLAAAVFFAVIFNFSLPPFLVCLLTVAAAVFATLKFVPDPQQNAYPLFRLLAGHLAVIFLIGLIWLPAINRDVFVSIRDNLLLSNPIGQQINNFYYRYTLYPAEAFKSLNQKLLKSCTIDIRDQNLNHRVTQKLIAQDYLPVGDHAVLDMSIVSADDRLVFMQNGKTIHQCAANEFLSDSQNILELISEKTDHNQFLRKITFLSLISASPLFCYIILHAAIMIMLFFVKSKSLRYAAASAGCLVIFSLSAVSFYLQPADTPDTNDIGKYLASDRWQERLSALKAISDRNLRVEQYINDIDPLVQSPLIAERYWLAKSLAGSRSPESYSLILRLLDDSQPNVVCMALYSLGKQKRFNASEEIIRRINSSGHWYVQWYAYKALRRLGWTQKK